MGHFGDGILSTSSGGIYWSGDREERVNMKAGLI
jgi:hypothetical protein